jgi:hypothetical protein
MESHNKHINNFDEFKADVKQNIQALEHSFIQHQQPQEDEIVRLKHEVSQLKQSVQTMQPVLQEINEKKR